MHVHVAGFFTLPSLLVVGFGLAAEDYTDWVKWALKDLLPVGLFGGFAFGGTASDKTAWLEFSDLQWENAGVATAVMAALWTLYGVLVLLGRTLGEAEGFLKGLLYVRYFIVTAQLCLCPPMWYSSIYALKTASMTSQGSSINVCLAIFVSIYLVCFLLILLLLHVNMKPLNLFHPE